MSKYPAGIVEKVAKAMAIFGDYDGCFERLEGWANASEEQRELREVEEPMSFDEEDADFWRARAVAAFDALELEEERQGPRFYKDSPSRRYATPWKAID